MQEWYTTKEIADMYGVTVRDVQEAVRTLRRAGVISTTPNPKDERQVLVHQSGLDAVKRALLINDGSATA
jgi:DNA-binding MarR family transcriptional regulator